jgi:hypothetical protein
LLVGWVEPAKPNKYGCIKQVNKGVINPDFALKMGKNLDPLKIFISQPLKNANFNGPSRL